MKRDPTTLLLLVADLVGVPAAEQGFPYDPRFQNHHHSHLKGAEEYKLRLVM